MVEETNEWSASDEPYVIVFVTDVSQKVGPIAVPNASTTVLAFEDADAGSC